MRPHRSRDFCAESYSCCSACSVSLSARGVSYELCCAHLAVFSLSPLTVQSCCSDRAVYTSSFTLPSSAHISWHSFPLFLWNCSSFRHQCLLLSPGNTEPRAAVDTGNCSSTSALSSQGSLSLLSFKPLFLFLLRMVFLPTQVCFLLRILFWMMVPFLHSSCAHSYSLTQSFNYFPSDKPQFDRLAQTVVWAQSQNFRLHPRYFSWCGSWEPQTRQV